MLRMSRFFIAIGKTFGTGIVLACALVHMLLPAVESLTGPCVPASFNEDYPAFPYLFAMLAALAVQSIEMMYKDVVRTSTPKVLSSTCSDDNCDQAVSLPLESQRVWRYCLPLSTSTSRNVHILSLLAAEFGFTMHSSSSDLPGASWRGRACCLLIALAFHQSLPRAWRLALASLTPPCPPRKPPRWRCCLL